MTDKKAQSVDELEVLVAHGDMDAKRELARRLMEGNGVPQNHPKAVALLEDCAALGDAETMLMLAKCCAFGHGTGQDTKRAESLICEAANKGNDEALFLMKFINDWKGQQCIKLGGCLCHIEKKSSSNDSNVVTGQIGGKLTIERVCILMNIVPCNEIDMASQSCEQVIECQCQTKVTSLDCTE